MVLYYPSIRPHSTVQYILKVMTGNKSDTLTHFNRKGINHSMCNLTDNSQILQTQRTILQYLHVSFMSTINNLLPHPEPARVPSCVFLRLFFIFSFTARIGLSFFSPYLMFFPHVSLLKAIYFLTFWRPWLNWPGAAGVCKLVNIEAFCVKDLMPRACLQAFLTVYITSIR